MTFFHGARRRRRALLALVLFAISLSLVSTYFSLGSVTLPDASDEADLDSYRGCNCSNWPGEKDVAILFGGGEEAIARIGLSRHEYPEKVTERMLRRFPFDDATSLIAHDFLRAVKQANSWRMLQTIENMMAFAREKGQAKVIAAVGLVQAQLLKRLGSPVKGRLVLPMVSSLSRLGCDKLAKEWASKCLRDRRCGNTRVLLSMILLLGDNDAEIVKLIEHGHSIALMDKQPALGVRQLYSMSLYRLGRRDQAQQQLKIWLKQSNVPWFHSNVIQAHLDGGGEAMIKALSVAFLANNVTGIHWQCPPDKIHSIQCVVSDSLPVYTPSNEPQQLEGGDTQHHAERLTGAVASAAAMAKVAHDDRYPLISVLMVTGGTQPLVDMAIRSILVQSWKHLELIVIDDGSDDERFNEIHAQLKTYGDPRLRLLRTRHSAGPYVTKNFGLKHARGRFVTFQDWDDWRHPQSLELQVLELMDAAERNASTLAVSVPLVRLDPEAKLPNPRVIIAAPCFVCLLFDRSRVLSSVGYFDSTSMGADSELMRRFGVVFGPDAIISVTTAPLLIAQASSHTLTGGSNPLGRDNLGMREGRQGFLLRVTAWHKYELRKVGAEVEAKSAEDDSESAASEPLMDFPITDPPFDHVVRNVWRGWVWNATSDLKLSEHLAATQATATLRTPSPKGTDEWVAVCHMFGTQTIAAIELVGGARNGSFVDAPCTSFGACVVDEAWTPLSHHLWETRDTSHLNTVAVRALYQRRPWSLAPIRAAVTAECYRAIAAVSPPPVAPSEGSNTESIPYTNVAVTIVANSIVPSSTRTGILQRSTNNEGHYTTYADRLLGSFWSKYLSGDLPPVAELSL